MYKIRFLLLSIVALALHLGSSAQSAPTIRCGNYTCDVVPYGCNATFPPLSPVAQCPGSIYNTADILGTAGLNINSWAGPPLSGYSWSGPGVTSTGVLPFASITGTAAGPGYGIKIPAENITVPMSGCNIPTLSVYGPGPELINDGYFCGYGAGSGAGGFAAVNAFNCFYSCYHDGRSSYGFTDDAIEIDCYSSASPACGTWGPHDVVCGTSGSHYAYMLMVNGIISEPSDFPHYFWGQPVQLCAGQKYTFSYWARIATSEAIPPTACPPHGRATPNIRVFVGPSSTAAPSDWTEVEPTGTMGCMSGYRYPVGNLIGDDVNCEGWQLVSFTFISPLTGNDFICMGDYNETIPPPTCGSCPHGYPNVFAVQNISLTPELETDIPIHVCARVPTEGISTAGFVDPCLRGPGNHIDITGGAHDHVSYTITGPAGSGITGTFTNVDLGATGDLSIPLPMGTMGGTYTITITSILLSGCTEWLTPATTLSATFTIYGTDAGIISPPTDLCVGHIGTYTSTVSGGTWSCTSGLSMLTTSTTSPAQFQALVTGGTETITYRVSTPCGPYVSTQTVHVHTNPTVVPHTDLATICAGEAFNLESDLSATDYTIDWYFGSSATGSPFAIGTSAPVSPVITSVCTDEYYYVEVINNTTGCSVGAPLDITVLPSPPSVGTIVGSTSTVCYGDPSITLTVPDATTGSCITTDWSTSNPLITVTGGALDWSGTAGYTVPESTTISCHVYDACGGRTSTYPFIVNPIPAPSISWSSACVPTICPGCTTASCPGNEIDFTIWGNAGDNVTYSGTGISVTSAVLPGTWFATSFLVVPETGVIPSNNLTITSATNTVTGCTSGPIDVEANANVAYPSVVITATQPCVGMPFTVTVTGAPGTIITGDFYDDFVFGATPTPFPGGPIILSGGSGCCDGSYSFTVPGISESWTFEITSIISASGCCAVSLASMAAAGIDPYLGSVNVTPNPNPTITTPSPISECGTCATIDITCTSCGGSGIPIASYSYSGPAAGTYDGGMAFMGVAVTTEDPFVICGLVCPGAYSYNIVATDINGCISNAVESDITLNPVPTATLTCTGNVCESPQGDITAGTTPEYITITGSPNSTVTYTATPAGGGLPVSYTATIDAMGDPVIIPETLTETTTFTIVDVMGLDGCDWVAPSTPESCTLYVNVEPIVTISCPSGVGCTGSDWIIHTNNDLCTVTYAVDGLEPGPTGCFCMIIDGSTLSYGTIDPSHWAGPPAHYHYSSSLVGIWIQIESISLNGCTWGPEAPVWVNVSPDNSVPTAPRGVAAPTKPTEAANILVFPNPTSGIFTLEIPGKFGAAEVTISDIVGKTIQRRTINESKMDFDLSGYAHGVYMLKVKVGETVFVEKVTFE